MGDERFYRTIGRSNNEAFYTGQINDSIFAIKRELEKIRRNCHFVDNPSVFTRLINSITLALRRFENEK